MRKGEKMSEELKKLISDTTKINYKNGFNPNLGKHWKLSEQAKINISNGKKGSTPWNKGKKCPTLSGKNCHFWKNGVFTRLFNIKEYGRNRYKNLTEEQREERKEYDRNWYKNLTDEQKKYISWRKNKRNRLKRTINHGGSLHAWEEWVLLKIKYNLTCPCCKKSEPEIKLTEDHIIPLSKGGSDSIENIQPLCSRCNIKKHTQTIKY